MKIGKIAIIGILLLSIIQSKYGKITKQDKKDTIMFFGYLLATGWTLLMAVSFFNAYFRNGFWFTVYINKFGEAHFELVGILLLLPFIFYGLYLQFLQFKKREKNVPA